MATLAPVLFVHGPFLHASSWQPWLDLFRSIGFETHAPRWPGEAPTVEETRRHPERLAGIGYGALARHYARIVDRLDEPPILVGHSVGGHVVQQLHALGLARATVALAPLQFRGVRGLRLAQLQAVLPVLRNPANYYRAISLTAAQFHRVVCSELSREASDAIYVRYAIPSTVRPVFQTTFANLARERKSKARIDTDNRGRGPLLIVAAERDRVVPPRIAEEEALRYARPPSFTILPGAGHSFVVDPRWRQTAETVLVWLARHDLAPLLPAPTPEVAREPAATAAPLRLLSPEAPETDRTP